MDMQKLVAGLSPAEMQALESAVTPQPCRLPGAPPVRQRQVIVEIDMEELAQRASPSCCPKRRRLARPTN